MGIVMKQSAANTVVTYFGFGIGAVNALFLYTTFLGKLDYGIVQYVLSGANILMPFLAFGVHNTLVRFFSRYASEKEREVFLTFMLFVPLIVVALFMFAFWIGYDFITGLFLSDNEEVRPYFWLIPVIGVFMAYFEIFYAWVKVHMRSVLGNLISEVLVRVIVMGLLLSLHFGQISKHAFIYGLALAYGLQFFTMFLYAVKVRMPKLRLSIPAHGKELLYYSVFAIMSGGVAVLLVDFDKIIIGRFGLTEGIAVYGVGIFIATVIAVPARAMLQIVYPITAKLMVEKKYDQLDELYKKSAITLQYFGGFILLCIFLNISQMYKLIPGHYEAGTMTVFLIGLSKFCDVMLGNNNSIILNTRYYRAVLLFGLLLVALMLTLNIVLIPLYGITGSALATLISVVIYNSIKLAFVVKKTGMYPFTSATWKSLCIIAGIFLAFYFWEFPFHPFVNIFLKSGLIAGLYVYLNHIFEISPDVNAIVGNALSKVRRRKA